MKNSHYKWFGFLLVCTCVFMSCAGTEIRQKYADDAFTGKVSSFLVIALIGSPYHQELFEKAFVSKLKSIGVDAVSSAEVMKMPSDLELTKEMILEAVRKYKNDAVFITRLVGEGSEEVDRIVPYDFGYYGYYKVGYGFLHGRVQSVSKTTVLLETDLFDVRTEKLIWSGISKTKLADPEDGDVVRDFVKAMTDKLKKSPLISR